MNREEALVAMEKGIAEFLAEHPAWERVSANSRMLIHSKCDRWTLGLVPCEKDDSSVHDPEYELKANGTFSAGSFGDYKVRVQSYTLGDAFKLLKIRVKEEIRTIQESLNLIE